MNIRQNIDCTEMYKMLDKMMAQQLPQMELYCAIGKAVCQRTEKGAAVMVAEYLRKHYPDVSGFSPRNVRRMRDFYRTYENHPKLLELTMQIGWIQNVVIMEADLTMELREWYLKVAKQFGWSKAELIANISAASHEEIILDNNKEMWFDEEKREKKSSSVSVFTYNIQGFLGVVIAGNCMNGDIAFVVIFTIWGGIVEPENNSVPISWLSLCVGMLVAYLSSTISTCYYLLAIIGKLYDDSDEGSKPSGPEGKFRIGLQ